MHISFHVRGTCEEATPTFCLVGVVESGLAGSFLFFDCCADQITIMKRLSGSSTTVYRMGLDNYSDYIPLS